MNIESLTADLAHAQAEFARLDMGHWRTVQRIGWDKRPQPMLRYRTIDAQAERHLVLLAERIERLQRFASWMRAKALDSKS